jgi:hypothetical membrane protein
MRTGSLHISARIAMAGAAGTILLLALLHVLSPELQPSWRMVSEYANGGFGWVLSLMFIAWGLASLSLAYGLRSQLSTRGGKIGLVLLVVAGIGQILAGLFDVNHPLHGHVGNIAIPSFALAAVLISKSLKKNQAWAASQPSIMRFAHFTWISVVLLVVSFVVLMTTYVQSGGDLNAGTKITELPDGVIAVVGWTNRLLVVTYAAWVAVVSWQALKIRA